MEVSDEDGGGSDEKKTTPPYPTPSMVQPSNLQPAKRKMKTPFQLEHLEKAFIGEFDFRLMFRRSTILFFLFSLNFNFRFLCLDLIDDVQRLRFHRKRHGRSCQ